jgi:simple sugar transport system permease protein
VIGACAIVASGNNPAAAYRILFTGAFGSYEAFANTLRVATPLIFAALAFSIGLKAGAFNAGIQGQFALATFATAWIGVKLSLWQPLLIVILFGAAMISGLVWATVPIVLRVYFNTNELIPAFLLNYVAALLVQYLIVQKFSDPLFNGITNGTPEVKADAKLPQIMPPYRVTIALLIIGAGALIALYVYKRMVLGYQLEMTGKSVRFARYGGTPTRRVWIGAMATSAMLAGAAAVPAVAGDQYRAVAGMLPNLMFDGIVVSLMALNNPIAIIPAAMFLGGLENSGIALQIDTNIPLDLVTVITGTIILFATAKRVGPVRRVLLWLRGHIFVDRGPTATPLGDSVGPERASVESVSPAADGEAESLARMDERGSAG